MNQINNQKLNIICNTGSPPVTQPIKGKIYCTQTRSQVEFSLTYWLISTLKVITAERKKKKKEKRASLLSEVYKGKVTGFHTLVTKNFNKEYQFRIFIHFYNVWLLLWITRNSNSEHCLLIFQSSSNQFVLIFN